MTNNHYCWIFMYCLHYC